MTPRWIAFLILLVAIALTGFSRRHPTKRAGYLAARDLPANTRVNSAVWTHSKGDTPAASWSIPNLDALTGKYVKEPLKKDDPILPENLGDLPALAFAADTIPFTAKLSDIGSLSDYVNAGGKVSVCDQDSGACSGGPYKVTALIGNIDSQLVLLLLTNQQSEEVHKIKKPTLRIAALP